MHATTWMNLEDIMLSEISQSQKDKDSIYMRSLEQLNSEMEGRIKDAKGLGGRMVETLFNGYRVSVWDDEKILEMDGGDGCTISECT